VQTLVDNYAIANTAGLFPAGMNTTDQPSAYDWYYNTANGATNQVTFGAAYKAGLLDGLSYWGNGTDNNILSTINRYITASSWSNLSTFLGKAVSGADKRTALSAAITNANISGTSTSLKAGFDSIISDTANNGSHLFDHLSTWSDMSLAITWWQTPNNQATFGAVYATGLLDGLSAWGTISTGVLGVLTNYASASAK
jgi:hypothetical protein